MARGVTFCAEAPPAQLARSVPLFAPGVQPRASTAHSQCPYPLLLVLSQRCGCVLVTMCSQRDRAALCSVRPSGRAQRTQGARGRCEERPYWDAVAKRHSVAPVASERVAGVPLLTVRAAGSLGGGMPACLVVTPPSVASAGFSVNENTPCSPPDPVFLRGAKDALLRALHGGHTGPPRREKVGTHPPS